MSKNREFWRGKRILLTGHTGFKGGWLAMWLEQLGAIVTGFSLAPDTKPNLFELAHVGAGIKNDFGDVRDVAELRKIVHQTSPEIVFHLAAQPLVRKSYQDPLRTFSTNVLGTANVLDVLRGQKDVKVAVIITTDKVYKNIECLYPYRENDVLGGHDPYSASKAASEIIVESYRDAFLAKQGVAVSTARAGNVIGGGDWSEDRLIPDAVRAWHSYRPLFIRRPNAIRPWQHVLEPLHGYLCLAEKMWHNPDLAGAYNFGPSTSEAASVREVVEIARLAFGSGDIIYGEITDGLHEASWLALETSKAREKIGIKPKWSLSESIRRTMVWYKAQLNGADVRSLCKNEIETFGF